VVKQKQNMVRQNFALSGTIALPFKILIQISMDKRYFENYKRNVPKKEILAGSKIVFRLQQRKAVAANSQCMGSNE